MSRSALFFLGFEGEVIKKMVIATDMATVPEIIMVVLAGDITKNMMGAVDPCLDETGS